MIVHVDQSPIGIGKTYNAIRQALRLPARWLFAVERLDAVDELAGRIAQAAGQNGNVVVREIKSTAALRGYSVRQEIEALPSKYEQGHVIVLCTHAALLMSDLRDFTGWHLVIDEVPSVLVMHEVRSKLDASFFENHYTLDVIDGTWSQVGLTELGKLIDGSDLQQDDSHRHLRLFHQHVRDSGRGERPVICNLRSWREMHQADLQWVWWSLFSVRQLESFETIRFLGNRFMKTVSAKMMQRWEPDVTWEATSTPGHRKLVSRSVSVRYFSLQRQGSKSFFESAKGQQHLGKIAAFIRSDVPPDRFIWSSNEVAAPALCEVLTGLPRLTPRQAGSDRWMHCTHAAMIYAAKPSPNIRAIIEALGLEDDDWIATHEMETVLQFVTRTSIRDVTSDQHAVVYVFDKAQADYLMSFFAMQPHIRAEAEFIDLGLCFSAGTPGPKVRGFTPEEAARRAEERRKKKARYERERRARKRAANSPDSRGLP